MAYKPEHAVDLDTGAIIAAEVHTADQGDTTTMPGTLTAATKQLTAVEAAPTPDNPAELVADKGYHARATLKALEDGPWKTRIAEPERKQCLRWHGDGAARRAVYNNRARLLSGVARAAFRLRTERVERGFALILDRGDMRRTWHRGGENVQKRYLIHIAGYNLGLIMRFLIGAGTTPATSGPGFGLAWRRRHTEWRAGLPVHRAGNLQQNRQASAKALKTI
ncbi:transposase [Rhodovastum atsumiense]